METYFVISNSDGDPSMTEYSEAKLTKALNDEDDLGRYEFFKPGERYDSDSNYWGDKCLIIKGRVVAPRVVEVVTQLEID